jgi:hypothetical protein
MSTAMRKQGKRQDYALPKVDKPVEQPKQEPQAEPKPRLVKVMARDCTACKALRDSDGKAASESYSRVYATVGKTRYCKCSYCGNTWKQVD